MKRILYSVVAVVVLFLIYVAFDDYDRDNDIIYFGRNILTMDNDFPRVEALYVKNGKIIATGKKDSILQLKQSNTKLIDLGTYTMLPGFIDPHGHFDLASVFYSMIDISGILYRKPDQVWNKVIHAINTTPKGKWIYCYGMDPILTEEIQTPSIQFLDSIAPNHPLVIITKALHVFYVNTKAFEILGINENTPDPSKASYYGKDKHGKLTGAIFEQEALEPFRNQIQNDVMKDYISNTQKVMDEYKSVGVTTAVNMGLSADKKTILNLYQHLSAEYSKPLLNLLAFVGKLPERKPHIRLYFYLRKENFDLMPEKNSQQDDFFRIVGVKMWYDGSPYSGSMYLRQPYIQSNFTINGINLNPYHRSHSLMKSDELLSWIEKSQEKGFPVAIHAQGDIANDDVIQVFKQIHQKKDINKYRHRLEHCMLLPAERLADMQKMSLNPSFHINHILYYGDFLNHEILGKERVSRIFPIFSTIQAGIPFSLHADMPQFIPNPLLLANTAVTRTTESGNVYNEAERISVLDALKSITINAAWQVHMEDKIGSIKPGKYADLVILDRNPLNESEGDMGKIKVLETIVAGNTVFKSKQ